MTASTYPKIKSLASLLALKNVKFSFSYNFGYIDQYEASLVLMVMSVFLYNMHCS